MHRSPVVTAIMGIMFIIFPKNVDKVEDSDKIRMEEREEFLMQNMKFLSLSSPDCWWKVLLLLCSITLHYILWRRLLAGVTSHFQTSLQLLNLIFHIVKIIGEQWNIAGWGLEIGCPPLTLIFGVLSKAMDLCFIYNNWLFTIVLIGQIIVFKAGRVVLPPPTPSDVIATSKDDITPPLKDADLLMQENAGCSAEDTASDDLAPESSRDPIRRHLQLRRPPRRPRPAKAIRRGNIKKLRP